MVWKDKAAGRVFRMKQPALGLFATSVCLASDTEISNILVMRLRPSQEVGGNKRKGVVEEVGQRDGEQWLLLLLEGGVVLVEIVSHSWEQLWGTQP